MKPMQPSANIIEKMSAKDRKALNLKTRDEIDTAIENKAESVIQSEVEAYLKLRGYWPRSPAFLEPSDEPPKGWFFHLNKAKRNPIILDLIIMSKGRCLELELKTVTGKLRPEQKVILQSDGTALARSSKEAFDIINEWEKE